MKRIRILFLLVVISGSFLSAQTTMKISPGTHLVAKGAPSIVLHNASWENNGDFTADQSTVHFSGTTEDSIVGSMETTFYDLSLSKTQDSMLLGQSISVDDTLYFVAGNLELAGNTLTLGTTQGGIAGEAESKRITGPNGGEVVKVAILGAPSGVNPGNMGAAITSAVSMGATIIRRGHVPQTLPNGSSIERYYVIDPVTNTGLNATVDLSYFEAELNGLDEAALESWHETTPNWINNEPDAADATANLVTVTLDTLGTMTLGEGALKFRPKVFLQGSFASGSMNDDLRSNALIPTTEPYTALGYAQVGGGNETTSAEVLNVTGTNAIVDWVFLELRSKTDSSVILRTQSALLQADGDVVGLDGVSAVQFAGLSQDEYFLQLKHRNHLGVRTPSAVTFARIETSHDFTTSLSQSWQKSGIVNASMVDVSGNGTVYALFTGDVTGDQFINATDFQGTSNLVSPNQFQVYEIGDLNLDGNLNATDFQTSNNVASPNKVGHVND